MATIIKDYDNFFFPVDDLSKAKEFYVNQLGLNIKFDYSEQGMIAFKVGEQEPAIIITDKEKLKKEKPSMWFVVDDVNKEYQILKEKGIHFLSEPFEIYTGLAIEFEDPFGNRLGLTDYSKYKKE